jgi:membrane-associated phospholipid phosphatase
VTTGLRFPEASATIRTSIPPAFDDFFAVVTMLGGSELLVFGIAVLYWIDRRREIATIISYGVVAYALVLLLKAGFALPRPPESVHVVPASNYGFPSGHATGGTVVYGAFALVFEWYEDLPKIAATVVLIGLISLSRVVLGVHYLGDVIAGMVLGVAVLAALYSFVGENPVTAFALSSFVAAGVVISVGVTPTTSSLAGGCLGGVVASRAVDSMPDVSSTRELAVLALVGTAFLSGVYLAIQLVETSLLGIALTRGVLVAGVLVLPKVTAYVPARSLTGSDPH